MSVNKKAVSDIITTVLIIMITIAAIGIVALFVFPIIQKSLVFSDMDVSLNIDEAVYDSSDQKVYLSVVRSAEEYELSGIQVVVYYQGNSDTFIIRSSENLPEKNEERSYALQKEYSSRPDSIAVAPYVTKGQLEKLFSLSGKKQISAASWSSGASEIGTFLPVEPKELSGSSSI